jgi:glycerol kinase
MVETTALGAAIAAGSASDVDVWRADKKQAMGMESFVATTTEAG